MSFPFSDSGHKKLQPSTLKNDKNYWKNCGTLAYKGNFGIGLEHTCVHVVANNVWTVFLLPVTSGVPQGSILGPTLRISDLHKFNDLPNAVNFPKVLLFADDTKCFKSISCEADGAMLQDDV